MLILVRERGTLSFFRIKSNNLPSLLLQGPVALPPMAMELTSSGQDEDDDCISDTALNLLTNPLFCSSQFELTDHLPFSNAERGAAPSSVPGFPVPQQRDHIDDLMDTVISDHWTFTGSCMEHWPL